MDKEKKSNILLVDDEPWNLSALEMILKPLKQKIIKVESGKEALKKVLEMDFIVILLDVRMPDMDGFEVAEVIRQREQSRSTPIVFITAYDKEDPHILKGYELGAVDYLFKPVIPQILQAKVTTFIELNKKSEEIRQREKKINLQQIKELETEINQLKQMCLSGRSRITSQSFGLLPFKEAYQEQFAAIVNQYEKLLEQALEIRTHKVDYNISQALNQLASELGYKNAVPRDIIEIHYTALKNRTSGLQKKKAFGYLEEARIMVLELMGYLASFYRSHSIIPPPDAKKVIDKNQKN